MDLEQEMLENLKNMKLTADEEDDIIETDEQLGKVYYECTLSLFGRFLSTKSFNCQAAKDTLRSIWRMGPDFRIVEVGNEILQFKFPTDFQRRWVLENGPWSFDNNLLLLREWEKGMSSRSLIFTHCPFWMQVWGLPFDLMSEATGEKIGSKLGRYVTGDPKLGLLEQAQFLRIRVEVPINKPLRRGGWLTSPEGEKI
jgi:hypothetical protein